MISRMLIVAGAAGLLASVASAQEITAGTAVGQPGMLATPDPVPVTFTRNAAMPVATYAARIQYETAQLDIVATGANGGICTANDGLGVIVMTPPAGQSDLASGTYCNLNVTVAPGAIAPGSMILDVTANLPGDGCFDSMANSVGCTLIDGVITITPGLPDTAPTIAYGPASGSTVTLTGGAGSIVGTPFGGTGTGVAATTTVDGCAIGAVSGPGVFGSAAGVNLSFAGSTTTAQNINLSCAQGGTLTTATLTCTETRAGGPPAIRSWPLSCPAGAGGAPPNLVYVPNFGNTVVFAGTPGTLINTAIAVAGVGGAGSGAAATARVDNCNISPALSPPVFACQPSGGTVLDFTPGGADPGDISCSCDAPATGQISATLTCEETRPLAGGAAVVRSWNLQCPGVPGSCGTLSFSPNPSLILFAGGLAAINIDHAGGTIGNDTTFGSCEITGANAGNFSIANAPIAFGFSGGLVGGSQISLACSNSSPAPVQATLSCSQVCAANSTPRTWTLECPADGAPPPTAEVLPVPIASDFSRILLAAMLVLIGMAAVTTAGRN